MSPAQLRELIRSINPSSSLPLDAAEGINSSNRLIVEPHTITEGTLTVYPVSTQAAGPAQFTVKSSTTAIPTSNPTTALTAYQSEILEGLKNIAQKIAKLDDGEDTKSNKAFRMQLLQVIEQLRQMQQE